MFTIQAKVSKFGDLLGVWKLETNAKFQLSISKIMQLGQKHRDIGCEYHFKNHLASVF